MFIKKTAVCFIIIIILIFYYFSPACAKYNFELKKQFKLYFFYSSLLGLGAGGNLQFNNTFSIHSCFGTEPLVPLIWTAPFSGNILNLHIKTEANLYAGCYFAAGLYTGLFNLKYKDFNISKFMWKSGPSIAIGIKFPNNFDKRRFGLEIGSVFNLPTKLSTIKKTSMDTWIVLAKRSRPAKGSLFPFITLMIELK